MLRTVRNHLDPPYSNASAAGVAKKQSILVAMLAFLSVGIASNWLAAPFAAAAAALAVLGISLQAARGIEAARQEARDLWGLSGAIVEGRPWPAPGGWSLGADALAYLLRELPRRCPRTVVELGPGSSSIVLGRLLPDAVFAGLEHDPSYADAVRTNLEVHHLGDYNLVVAPLKAIEVGSRTAHWYDTAELTQLPSAIDVLIVDGPPNLKGEGNRAAAWPLLGDRMGPGALILVDDTHRSDERRMVTEWLQDGSLGLLADRGSFMVLERK